MKRILIINGPNINLLGIREKQIYGNNSYVDLLNLVDEFAKENGLEITNYQSNHEGDIVDKIQQAFFDNIEGIVINPGAYTHTSIAILDALLAVKIPFIEVHISDVTKREDFRQISYIRPYALTSIIGEGIVGYIKALDILKRL